MGSTTHSQEMRGVKRKFDGLEFENEGGSVLKLSGSTYLCKQCEEDIPRFKATLDMPKALGLPKQGEHISSRTWPIEGVNSQCHLCQLFLQNSVRGKLESERDEDPVTFNIHRSSFLKCIDEIERSNAKSLDSVCLAAYLDSDSGDKPHSIVTPALTSPKDFHDKQMVHSSDASQNYAARVVDSKLFDRDLVSSWIKTCKVAHKGKCAPETYKIDARLPGNVQSVWLIDCKTRRLTTAKMNQQYLTLSYVWGKKNSHSRTPWKHQENAELPAVLPRTIEDAITVTLQLSYRYLWVDYYCINQSDENHKAAQIAIMNLIYMASDLVIIAGAGDDADSGLPGVDRLSRAPQNHFKVDEDLTLVSHLEHPHSSIYSSVWNTRGWTFQEGMLARRRLVFTNEQVYFECQCISTWESLRRPLARLASAQTKRIMQGVRASFFQNRCAEEDDFKHQGSKSNEIIFAKGLETFLNRRLTFVGDTLNAFQGFVEALYPQSNAYGLPLLILGGDTVDSGLSDSQTEGDEMTVQLIRALYWEYSAHENSVRRPNLPSFSWAGWTGQQPNFRLTDTFHATSDMARFPDLHWEQLTENPPMGLKIDGFASRLALKCRWDGLKIRYLLPDMAPGDVVRMEISRPIYGEGRNVAVGKKSMVEREIGILFLAHSRSKTRSWLKFLLFERKEDFAERCGTLAWALDDDLTGSEESAAIGEFERFLKGPWEREVLTFQ